MTRTRSVWYLLYRSNFGYKSTKLVVFNTFNTYNTYVYEILRVGWSICLGWGRNLKIEQTWLLKKGPHYGVLTATTSQRHSNSLRWRGLHSVKKGGRFSAAFASAMFLKWMHDVALDWASLTFPCLSLAVWLRARFLARYPLNGVILAESGLKYPLEHPAVHIAAAGAPVKSPSKLPPANGDLRLGETEADIYIYIYLLHSTMAWEFFENMKRNLPFLIHLLIHRRCPFPVMHRHMYKRWHLICNEGQKQNIAREPVRPAGNW